MRLALASLVIFSHCWTIIQGTDEHEPLARWSRGGFTIGGSAVYAFFVISGFLVSASLKRSSSGRSFLLKRVLRIYPGFIAATLIGFFVVAPAAGLSWKWLLRAKILGQLVIGSLLLRPLNIAQSFPNNPQRGSVNAALWTIAYEFACYLLLPMVGLIGAFRRRRRWILWVLLAADLAGDFIHHNNPLNSDMPPFYLDCDRFCRFSSYFLAGAIFFAYRDVIKLRSIVAAACAATLFIAARFIVVFIFVGPVCMAYLIVWIAFTPSVRLHHFGKFGDFSYGTYVYGFPIQQLVVQSIGASRLTPLGLFAISWPLTLLAGVTSWFFVERPFIALKARKIQPIPEPDLQKAVAGA